MRRSSTPILLLVTLVQTLVQPAAAQDAVTLEALPGYYEFFMKTGRLERIGPERQRDVLIDAGKLAPETRSDPLPAFILPNAAGEAVELRAAAEAERNLLIVSFRSWW